MQEAQTGVIDFSDHEPDIVNCMIQYMYKDDYNIERPDPTPEPEVAEETTSTEQENTPSTDTTESTANNIIEKDSKDHDAASLALQTHTSVYLLAEEKDIAGLKNLAAKKYEELLPVAWNSASFCTSLKRIYEGTPDSDRLLKDVAIQFAGSKAKELMDRGEFKVLLKENGEIGLEVFNAYIAVCNPPPPMTEGLFCPQGCPDKGVQHAVCVEAGKRHKYFCLVCKKAFD